MKILLSRVYAIGENNDPPACVAVLIPSKALFQRVLRYMRKAEELEGQIDGFIRMDIQDWCPFFIDSSKLVVVAEELDGGRFHEVETSLTEKALKRLTVERSPYVRIDSCIAYAEKERIGWEFYLKHWDIPFYTGTVDREFVEKRL